MENLVDELLRWLPSVRRRSWSSHGWRHLLPFVHGNRLRHAEVRAALRESPLASLGRENPPKERVHARHDVRYTLALGSPSHAQLRRRQIRSLQRHMDLNAKSAMNLVGQPCRMLLNAASTKHSIVNSPPRLQLQRITVRRSRIAASIYRIRPYLRNPGQERLLRHRHWGRPRTFASPTPTVEHQSTDQNRSDTDAYPNADAYRRATRQSFLV